MSPGTFLHPEWALPVALLVAGTGVAVALAAWRGGGWATRLLGPRGRRLARRARARDAALLLALAAIGAALLAPRLGERSETTIASGVDVVVLVDASRSMDARDVAPSRLRRARRIAEDLLARLAPGDRAALAAFGDRGALLTPLTPDTDALLELLPAFDGDLFRWRASRLADGLRAALGAFEPGSPRPRVVLLLSDGEDPSHEESLGAAAEAVQAERVRVVAVALGTAVGALVPDHDAALRDRDGHEVVSHADRARLAALAAASGGALLDTDAFGAVEPEALLAELRRDAGAAPGERVVRRVPAARVAPFAVLAFALLLAELGPGVRPRGRPARLGLAAGLVLALLATFPAAAEGPAATTSSALSPAEREVVALEAAAHASPGDARLLVELGLARSRAERHDEASRAFLAAALAATEPDLAALAYYDLGVSSLARSDLAAARDAFFDSLALAPDDREARFNLEWTLRALAARPPETPSPDARRGAKPPTEEGAPGARGLGGENDARAPQRPPASPADGQRERTDAHATEPTARDGQEADARERGPGQEPSPRKPAAAPPPLSPERARRLLEDVADAPGPALRQLTRQDASTERANEPRGPVW
jgi:Ca-activated chloride channel family protein